jgi:gluconolactonase
VLADHFQQHRLNSPNDLVYRSDARCSDPPFGLPKFGTTRAAVAALRVYSVRTAGSTGQHRFYRAKRPRLSPDEKFLYVGDWNTKKAVVNRYSVNADATLGKGELFFDLTTAGADDAIDGIKVDRAGDVFVSGRAGGSPEGRPGTLRPGASAQYAGLGTLIRRHLSHPGNNRIRLKTGRDGFFEKVVRNPESTGDLSP